METPFKWKYNDWIELKTWWQMEKLLVWTISSFVTMFSKSWMLQRKLTLLQFWNLFSMLFSIPRKSIAARSWENGGCSIVLKPIRSILCYVDAVLWSIYSKVDVWLYDLSYLMWMQFYDLFIVKWMCGSMIYL